MKAKKRYVYLIYNDDGCGNYTVSKVYGKRKDAIKHIIKNVFKDNDYYKEWTQKEKEKHALKYIERWKVI